MTTSFQDTPQIDWLPDGKRLLMRHGPIELVLKAEGSSADVQRGYSRAVIAFMDVLSELTDETSLLRRPVGPKGVSPEGGIAKNMWTAANSIASGRFATPMIAVAGAVADHILANLTRDTNLSRAFVNNGGDISVYLAAGEVFDVGVCSDPLTGSIASTARITADAGIGGIATSGWRGRSHSLGIADAVTVFAQNAAIADAAATLIANEIDLPGHPAIARQSAETLSPDSDLGPTPVTTDVLPLSKAEIETALHSGRRLGQDLIDKGQIISVFASLQSEMLSLTNNRQMVVPRRPSANSRNTVREAVHA